MNVEVLGFSDCPNTPVLRERVAVAVRDAGSAFRLRYVDQCSLAENDPRRGYPAPTVLVEGIDLFGLSVSTTTAMGCRVYAGGLPSVEEIRSRLLPRR
jgi:hypothetical protein